MKIGLGLYRQMLNDEHFAFARQMGVSHVVAHLEDYFSAEPELSSGDGGGWGRAGAATWSFDTFRDLIDRLGQHDLKLAAIENLPVAGWSDILLDGPDKDRQMDGLKQMVRDAGRSGVPCIGYNFSLAGVWGWSRGPFARGGAMNGLDGEVGEPHRLPPTTVDENPTLALDLASSGIQTVLWATGYRPDYSWLHVPVFDRKGGLRHDGGVVDAPGLYVLGLQFLRRRKSALIDGAGDDANALSNHLSAFLDGVAVPPEQRLAS